MTDPVPLFPLAGESRSGVLPRRPRSMSGLAAAGPIEPVQPTQRPTNTKASNLKLTAADVQPGYTARHIQLLIPDDEIQFVTEQLARYGHSLGEVSQVNACIALAVLEENEKTGKPVMVSYVEGKFKITLMDEIPVRQAPPPQSSWKRLMFWRR